ncbi:hypothetical protein AOX59_15795 [Lentibacillus amyloliquefaciens]|uniref:Uncharacterized protein n=1 Tax=Lentibacillus amyloliquefaciens TaxID=1472767 RepID=A0A0U4FAT2_9BACI|nr:hypothetical protein AOX59_15795 [Lentibacillus amyloliquefaciens]
MYVSIKKLGWLEEKLHKLSPQTFLNVWFVIFYYSNGEIMNKTFFSGEWDKKYFLGSYIQEGNMDCYYLSLGIHTSRKYHGKLL